MSATTADVASPNPPRAARRSIRPEWSSTLDPLAEVVLWRAWQVTALRPFDAGDPNQHAIADAFRLLTEQLHLPGRTLMLTQMVVDGDSSHVELHLAVGVCEPQRTAMSESDAVGRLVQNRLARYSDHFTVREIDADAVLTIARRTRSSAIVRQRTVSVDGANDDISFVSRWNPTTDPWAAAAALLAGEPGWFCLRATAVATTVGISDQHQLREALREAARAHAQADEHPERVCGAARAVATLTDIQSSLSSPVLCGELAILTDRAELPDRLVRAIATCFTSEADVVRRSGHSVVAPHAVVLGGFEIDRNPALHAKCIALGLPLRGSLAPRTLADLWSLAESPLGWPRPTFALPGIDDVVVPSRPAPAALTQPERRPSILLGHDCTGAAVGITETEARLHVSISGRSGMGKSTLMAAMIRQDLAARRPFLLIDPHDDTARRVVDTARTLRRKIVVIDATNPSTSAIRFTERLQPDGSNLDRIETAARIFAAAAVSHLPTDWAGPRFMHGATALLIAASTSSSPLSETFAACADESETRALARRRGLPEWVSNYLLSRFDRRNVDSTSVADWIDSKFSTFFAGEARQLLAPPGCGVDLGEALADGTPVVISLGALPRADADLVGHVALSLATEHLMRLGVRPVETTGVRIYVDEAPRFPASNLNTLLTAGRKFGIALVAACQSLRQYGPELADVALGAATQVAFAQTPDAAGLAAPLLDTTPSTLVDQSPFHAVTRIGANATFDLRVENPYQ